MVKQVYPVKIERYMTRKKRRKISSCLCFVMSKHGEKVNCKIPLNKKITLKEEISFLRLDLSSFL